MGIKINKLIKILKYLKMMLQDLTLEEWMSISTLCFGLVGGMFALYQWRKSNVYKRAEIVQQLIKTVRDDVDISTVMDIIDWNKGFNYDGKFHLCQRMIGSKGIITSDDEFFKKIDKTLSHFSYICYLKKNCTLTKKDMRVFDYEIRRLADNIHIANYLYSLWHWSASLGVDMSFSFLIKYCEKRGYIKKKDFGYPSNLYSCYLELPANYKSHTKGKMHKRIPT